MNNTLENNGKFPWYRGRVFWGLILSPLFSYSLYIYVYGFGHFPPLSISDTLYEIAFSFGGFPIMAFIASLFNYSETGHNLGIYIYIHLFGTSS